MELMRDKYQFYNKSFEVFERQFMLKSVDYIPKTLFQNAGGYDKAEIIVNKLIKHL
jgi:hypothetical protein